MQFSVPREQKTGLFSAHAVMILILLYTLVGRQLSPSLGRRQGRYRTRRDNMLRKGTRDKRGLNNRHMGTLSISVHEDKEGMTKTLLPRHPNTRGGQNHQGTFKSPDHKLRACTE